MKKLITFLGTGDYSVVTYNYGNTCVRTRYVQECIANILGSDVEFIVVLTEKAKATNWEGKGKAKGSDEECDKLQNILIKNNIKYRELEILDGNNSDEMWSNFDKIFDALEEGDEVYVDVTHSFRSIPFIIMSVLNYARFIKNIEVKDIFYGAYDAKVNDVAPIFNLSIFNHITDWTIGAEKFLNTGDSRQLAMIISSTIKPILIESKGKNQDANIARKIKDDLESFSGGLYTVRGNSISEYGIALKTTLESIKKIELIELKPFEKILDKIFEKVYFYSDSIVRDIHNTVKLSRDLRLIQQSYTFLQENIINYLCHMGNINIHNVNERELTVTVLLSYHKLKNIKLKDEYLIINEKIKDYASHELAALYDDIGDYRNDLNHAGYRQDSKEYKGFAKKLDSFILDFEKLVFDKNVEMELIV